MIALEIITRIWFWHPFDAAKLFSIRDAIQSPPSLDDSTSFPSQQTEVATVAFLGSGKLVVSMSDETFSDGDYEPHEFQPRSVGVWDIAAGKICAIAPVGEPVGTLMPIDDQFAVSFFQQPKIVNLKTGELTSRLQDLPSGQQTSSIIHHIPPPPPLAIDVAKRRFAIATDSQIAVVQVTN